MNSSQKEKTKFRQSAKWQKFRHYLNVIQKGIDPITHKKLYTGANAHHLDLSDKNYKDLSHPDRFMLLNKETHKMVHWLYTYYRKDPDILIRLKDLLDRMVEINEEK